MGQTSLLREKAPTRPQAQPGMWYLSSWRTLPRRSNAGHGLLNKPEITPPSHSNHRRDGTDAGPGLLQSAAAIRGSLNPAGHHLSSRKLLFRQTEPPLIVLTDNGTHFTTPGNTALSAPLIKEAIARGELFRAHAFELACAQNDIDHRLTKPRHPWTNGQVERMNRTIKDATVRRYHYESRDLLRQHLSDFVD